jgi:DNA-directed RNA polymerase subunit RPC12/RpoP
MSLLLSELLGLIGDEMQSAPAYACVDCGETVDPLLATRVMRNGGWATLCPRCRRVRLRSGPPQVTR